jgi:hypothetical protein
MRNKLLLCSVLMLGLFIAACGGQANTVVQDVTPGTADVLTVVDQNSLMEVLKAAGLTVENGDSIEQPFFTVPAQIIRVNGADVQVFQYETPEAMEADASQVAEDGGSVGTSMMSWMATPHFYKTGRILVLYVGDDQKVIDVLTGALGPQFAGR